eukprot:3113481-Prymnesium_polylepis.1
MDDPTIAQPTPKSKVPACCRGEGPRGSRCLWHEGAARRRIPKSFSRSCSGSRVYQSTRHLMGAGPRGGYGAAAGVCYTCTEIGD